ncbi:hypothetical protein [Actinoplanes xinjiangensis]|uniref:HEAT repeat protein n=1 Tax=Actinoplanes xinjiangensis TaxID=512350 RepID=A0A316FVE9_9ACTN|nr:hypothetical protein [Actinoplanes xinjiangensis]PWK51570.1 hypothetical protein BC793_102603 [Actinoplanes xinjiangensis]GIF35931.1 hypothetical protein Axi01nite_02420 [Actinoplanes xinjiangensis]
MTDPVRDLCRAGRAHLPEHARSVLFPRRFVLDRHSWPRLARLGELCAAGDTPTRTGALRAATEVLRWIETDVLPFERIDGGDVRSWVGDVGRAAVRHLDDTAVLALYQVFAQEIFPPAGPITGRLDEAFLSSRDPALRLAAAVCAARLGGGPACEDVLREFLARPLPPGDEVVRVLGPDVRGVIRRAMDGRPGQIPMFAEAIGAGDVLARWGAVGQCRRLMETWRAAPARLVPVLAGCLTDGAVQVRQAAMSALRMSGEAARDHLGAIGRFFREPLSGVTGTAPERLVDLARGSALETMVRFRSPEAVAPLRDFLAAPHGHGSVQLIVADAAWCAPEIAGKLAVHLHDERAGAILNALRGWGAAAAPLLPALVALHATGRAQRAVLEILAGLGPAAAAAGDLLLAELQDHDHDPVRRGHAAAALLRCGLAVDEAAAALVSEIGHPVAQKHLATLDWPPALRDRMTGRTGDRPAAAYAARLAWRCGDRGPWVAADLLDRVNPLAGGILALTWLAGTGDLMEPHRPALQRMRDDPGRPGSGLIPSLKVEADERFRRALTEVLPDRGAAGGSSDRSAGP